MGCLIEANDAPEGGGLYAADASGASVEATTICSNTFDQAAGAFADRGTTASPTRARTPTTASPTGAKRASAT